LKSSRSWANCFCHGSEAPQQYDTACLVYFQIALLAGYLYAHGLTSYLKRGHQAIVHSLLLQASLILLGAAHFAVPCAETGANPTAKIFLLLTVWIGLPFLLLSATGPLIQS
jgi:heme/copper-type cytochrome/quinol oxidase subunit 3